jgi:DNA-binding transcriptional LysR family regulator
MINPVLLRTFCTLAETQHYTKTANKLHITQSGVSQHIKKLEDSLDIQLIDRTEKGFKLTSNGETAYQEAKALLISLQQLKDKVKSDSPHIGKIRVMSPGSVGLYLYAELLKVQQKHPELVIDYRFGPNHSVLPSIENGTIDIGLLTERPNTSANIFELITEPLLLVTPSNFDSPCLQSLNQLGFINHPDGHHHANLLLSENFNDFEHISYLKESGFSNQISLILEPVSMGLGFTVLPEHAVMQFRDQTKIKVHRLPSEVKETIYCLSKKRNKLPKRVRFILDEITSLFKID